MPAIDRPVVTRQGQESANTGQSGGLMLVTGVGPQNTPATKIWFGKASNPPGFRSLPHHHGEAETGAYLLAGRARIYFGNDYREYVIPIAPRNLTTAPPHPRLELRCGLNAGILECRTLTRKMRLSVSYNRLSN